MEPLSIEPLPAASKTQLINKQNSTMNCDRKKSMLQNRERINEEMAELEYRKNRLVRIGLGEYNEAKIIRLYNSFSKNHELQAQVASLKADLK